jgi:hypothetical protein
MNVPFHTDIDLLMENILMTIVLIKMFRAIQKEIIDLD